MYTSFNKIGSFHGDFNIYAQFIYSGQNHTLWYNLNLKKYNKNKYGCQWTTDGFILFDSDIYMLIRTTTEELQVHMLSCHEITFLA